MAEMWSRLIDCRPYSAIKMLLLKVILLSFLLMYQLRLHRGHRVPSCGLLLPMLRVVCVRLSVHGRPHIGANGVSWPPGKMDEK